MRRKITSETWEQIKTGYAAGINLREIARKNEHPTGGKSRLNAVFFALIAN